MNSENRRSVTSIGITSFVLIFVMLCLLTFSVLSLATARADLRLSQRSADRTTAYYDAENRANDILLEIISCMEDCLSETGDDTDMEEGADAASFYTSVRDSLEGQNASHSLENVPCSTRFRWRMSSCSGFPWSSRLSHMRMAAAIKYWNGARNLPTNGILTKRCLFSMRTACQAWLWRNDK